MAKSSHESHLRAKKREYNRAYAARKKAEAAKAEFDAFVNREIARAAELAQPDAPSPVRETWIGRLRRWFTRAGAGN